jgi:hypothetical protein
VAVTLNFGIYYLPFYNSFTVSALLSRSLIFNKWPCLAVVAVLAVAKIKLGFGEPFGFKS